MPITENQLDEWSRSNARDAQGLIVELVWHLVAASCPKPRNRRFPLSDSIGQQGPDGILDVALSFEPFVPEGQSYWEIGTGIDAHSKATDDYKKLTDAVPEKVRHNTAFIFVTPLSGRRDWKYSWKEEAQAAWLDERLTRKEWKDVRIIDGTKLVDWLQQFPAVEFWLAPKISGIPPGQIEIPSQHWSLVSSIGEPPPLNTELFLVNRDEASSKLKEVFDGTQVQLKLTTHYVDQIVDFVAAYLASLDGESRADATGRCLILTGIDGWNTICNNLLWKNHILIADSTLDLSGDTGTKLIQKARRAGHAVIFGGPYGGLPDPASVPLPTPSGYQIQEALKRAGYNEERARALAQKSGGNLSSLLRCIQNLSILPAWAERSESAELAIAVFLGSWNDNSEADRVAIERLSGKGYGEWIRGMREVAVRPATPLILRDGIWKFIPRYEGWYSLGPYIFDEHLERFKNLSVSVLSEDDPKFELPPDERFTASIHGKVFSHSRALRDGLTETLALLGSHPEALKSCSIGRAEMTARLTIRELLSKSSWVRWASLDDFLPLLGEAAPEDFLDAVEEAFRQTTCPFDEIFSLEGTGGGILGENYLTGVLWALETLAWDPDYLSRAVICLGELAALDPGGQWGNRPANSLKAIFLPWLPQTIAPIAKRLSAVKTLLKEIPYVGWQLLLHLLPEQHSYSSGTRRPAWRSTIPDDWRQGVTQPEYREQVTAYAELAINEAKEDFSKLAELIEHMENLPPSVFEQLVDYLGSDAITNLAEADKFSLWTKLIKLVTKHRKFGNTDWAMKSEKVEKIAKLSDQLAPNSPFYLHQRIFSDHYLDLFEENGDYETRMKELGNRQKEAIREIAATGGLQAILAFSEAVQSARSVGIAFGSIADSDADKLVLPDLLESHNASLGEFAGGFVWGRYRSDGWDWVDNLSTFNWTPPQIGWLFTFLPFVPDTWERVDAVLGKNQSTYWSKTSVNPFEADTGLEFAIDKLIRFERPNAAIRCLHKILYDKKPIDHKLAVRALLAALKSSETPNQMDVYDLVEVIKAIQEDPESTFEELFQLEWAYLPLLDGSRGTTPKFLWRRLAEDPAFYCEVIQVVFRSKKDEFSTEEVTEERKNIATNAYRLLSEWRRPPGLKDDGSFDGDALNSWLAYVRNECSNSGHLEIAMTMVGHVLIYVPADPEGLWIHHSAADVLNEKDAQDLRDGFRTEIYNSRGVHWIDPTGKPEKELAAKYYDQAEAVEAAGFHRLASTLRILAKEYEHEAERIVSRDLFDD